jgi:HD-GYP domain-containing protein (c-di-GMP phosphodiesterase class II)
MSAKPSKARKVLMTKPDYQRILLEVATSMVRLKRPERLLKMITRFLARELSISHASLLLLDDKSNHFVFADSRGDHRLPTRLIKLDSDHPLIEFFQKHKKSPASSKHRCLYFSELKREAAQSERQSLTRQKSETGRMLQAMKDFKAELVVPGFHKKNLLGLLLLGKKTNSRIFSASEISFFQILVHDCSMAVKASDYNRHLAQKNQELARRLAEIEALREKENKTYYEIMRSLAQEVHAKDTYTFGHVNQVERLGIMTAREMGMDLSGRRKDILSAGLILHDVGKIGIPDSILKKTEKLNEEEWKIMKTHAEKGAKILSHLSDFTEVAEIVRCHHENVDGSGYPRGLKMDQIPIESRIISVVDAFHAIVSTRCYSRGRSPEAAFEELKRCSGTQFDAQVVEAFIRALEREMRKRGVIPALEQSEEEAFSVSV